MKNLLVVAIAVLFSATAFSQPSTSDKKEAYKVALEKLKRMESEIFNENTDVHAVKAIKQDKAARTAAYNYMTSLPEYEEAVKASADDMSAFKAWKMKVKTEDEKYITLANMADSAHREKTAYLSNKYPEYKTAYQEFSALRSAK
jgi:hypothetical protein